MSDERHYPGIRDMIGLCIGMGCEQCDGPIEAVLIEEGTNAGKYRLACPDCDYDYHLTFSPEALKQAAPDLLAAAVGLLSALMRSEVSGVPPETGKPRNAFVEQALAAIAEASGYPADFWKRAGGEGDDG